MHSTEGIILKKEGAGENDAVFTIYTKDFGKIRARAQGVKKETAKLKGHLEPLNLTSVGLVSGKNGERLTQAILLNAWPAIRENFEKISAAFYLTELVDKHCLAGEKDLPLWNLLLGSFRDLESGSLSENDSDFRAKFEEKFLACLGYAGEKDIGILDW